MPNAAEVVEQIATHLQSYVDGGPDREAECLGLAQRCGLKAEPILARWADARAARPKRRVIAPAPTPAPKPPAPFVRRDFSAVNARSTPVMPPPPPQEPAWMAQLDALADRSWDEWLAAAVANVIVGRATAEEIENGGWITGQGAVDEFRAVLQAATAAPKPIVIEAAPLVEPEPAPAADPEPPEPEPRVQLPAVVPDAAVVSDDAVKEMNNKHAVIGNLGGKCIVMEFVPGPDGRLTELSYQTFGSIRERYSNRYVMSGGKPTGLAQHWLSHPNRRQYEGLDLIPEGPQLLPNGYLNLWRGWGVDAKPGRWPLLRRHVEEVLANGDARFADYIIRWTAWALQNPGVPPEVALVLIGGKGSGKGVWGRTLTKIFGDHALQIFSAEHLSGKHNQHLQNKLFLFADEAFWAGDRKNEPVLKGLVTEPVIMIEPKNINAFQWKNRLAVLLAGNDKWVVPASHDERRYAVGRVSERWKQNKQYFAPLFAEIDGGGAAAMLWDLRRLDLEGWHPRDAIPQTSALVEQKMFSLNGLEQWWVEKLSSGELPKGPSSKNPRYVLSKQLLEDAKAHNLRNRYLTETEFGLFLREHGCEHKSNGKAWGWIFPPLCEAREAFRAAAGGEWQWLEPDLTEWGQKEPGEL
jgi:hypothetical protein